MKSMQEWSRDIDEIMTEKGFYCPTDMENEQNKNDLLGKLFLVVSELAEAGEGIRKNDYDNFKEEIADTFIRLLHICGSIGFDIEAEIEAKMVKNEARPFRHGKHTSL